MNQHKENVPSTEVVRAFGLKGTPQLLSGGQGTTWKIGDGVIKPIVDTIEATCVAGILHELVEQDFRVARPIKAANDSWVYKAWAAYRFVKGFHKRGLVMDKIAACKAFHKALKHYPKPNFLDGRTDIYALADRIAWQEQQNDVREIAKDLLERLQNLILPIETNNQLIHGDFTNNVLFTEGLPPTVIDFSPYWRPADYALAVILVDSFVWEGLNEITLKQIAATIPQCYQLMIRALIGRIMQFDLQMQTSGGNKRTEIEAHKSLVLLLCEITE